MYASSCINLNLSLHFFNMLRVFDIHFATRWTICAVIPLVSSTGTHLSFTVRIWDVLSSTPIAAIADKKLTNGFRHSVVTYNYLLVLHTIIFYC